MIILYRIKKTIISIIATGCSFGLNIMGKIKKVCSRIIVTGPENDSEFLPGALEITENPPSPIGRAIIWAIIAFIIGGIAWASLSKADVVAAAQGKLVPIGEIKLIQPLEVGIIREIHVKEGQHVKQGQPLLSFDPTASEADEANLRQQLYSLLCELALFDALVEWKPGITIPTYLVSLPEGSSSTTQTLYNERLKQETMVLAHTIASAESNLSRLNSQEQSTYINLEKYATMLAIDSEISESFKLLYKKSASSRHQWLIAEQTRVRTEQDRAQILEQLDELAAAKQGISQEIARNISSFRSEILKKKANTEAEIASLEQELAKATMRNSMRLLTSPVSGYVQQLAVHTLGGIVQSGETVMAIVPDGIELQLKLTIMNKDIGFIYEGQKVQIKLEAFPFTEYGMLAGEMATISAGAIQNEEGELLYPCTVSITENSIVINGKPVELKPGMVATGEIILRKRRLISYFLSPLLKHKQESLRER